MSKIHITTIIEASLKTVWECWTQPEHITEWYLSAEDCECSKAENDLRVGGIAKTTMAAKDGSTSLEIEMKYTVVDSEERIEYIMEDGREVVTTFIATYDGVLLEQWFDPETENSEDVQKQEWQAILNNFSSYAEVQ